MNSNSNSLKDEFSKDIFVLLDDWPRITDQFNLFSRWSRSITALHGTAIDFEGYGRALYHRSKLSGHFCC